MAKTVLRRSEKSVFIFPERLIIVMIYAVLKTSPERKAQTVEKVQTKDKKEQFYPIDYVGFGL